MHAAARHRRAPRTACARRPDSRWILLSLALALHGLAGCADPIQRYKVLSFFFDGVPLPAELAPPPEPSRTQATQPQATRSPREDDRNLVHHPPYFERECDSCHRAGQSQATLLKADLCFTCHPRDEVVPAVAHEPVGEGMCLDCHQPHESPEKALLLRPPKTLCADCHDLEDDAFTGFHDDIGDDPACLDCHDGHGGPWPRFLRQEPGFPACVPCHMDDLGRREPLHGPVAHGECLACHELHDSKTAGHLRQAGDALCLDCHDDQDLRSRPTHGGSVPSRCVTCHDPHGSGRPSLLREGATAPVPAKGRNGSRSSRVGQRTRAPSKAAPAAGSPAPRNPGGGA